MTEDKLNKITDKVTDIFRHAKFDDCIYCKHEDDLQCFDCEKKGTVYELLDVIASLHNELYKEVKGKYYNYMFHWANLGYGGDPDDSLWKENEDKN